MPPSCYFSSLAAFLLSSLRKAPKLRKRKSLADAQTQVECSFGWSGEQRRGTQSMINNISASSRLILREEREEHFTWIVAASANRKTINYITDGPVNAHKATQTPGFVRYSNFHPSEFPCRLLPETSKRRRWNKNFLSRPAALWLSNILSLRRHADFCQFPPPTQPLTAWRNEPTFVFYKTNEILSLIWIFNNRKLFSRFVLHLPASIFVSLSRLHNSSCRECI